MHGYLQLRSQQRTQEEGFIVYSRSLLIRELESNWIIEIQIRVMALFEREREREKEREFNVCLRIVGRLLYRRANFPA